MSPHQDGESAVRAPFRVGEWSADPLLSRVTRGHQVVSLRPRAMAVLVCLADRAGTLASKHHLIDTVWQADFVSDNALTHVIAELRTALGDDPQRPTYIETIPRHGYRLIAEVDLPETAAHHATRAMLEEPSSAGLPLAAATVEVDPYPGLSAFTEAHADVFFGREVEVARLWQRIPERKFLAIIGPSGAGKSSFLRAGVLPTAPEGWRAAVCEPGEAPFKGLARTFVTEVAGDADALRLLMDFDEPDVAVGVIASWRQRHDQALLIVDQFEELFTLNTPEAQARFAELLGRLADEAGVHVLLCMRDDFFFECAAHPALAAAFEAVTPLMPPTGASLRRAFVEPAERHGFTFENDVLVDEMLDEVAEERGALPLLAFTVARLWELRDRESKQLSRMAYEGVGGVGGALARHAEEVLEGIGEERLGIARELFRNLVTARGTRATRDLDELLSVFDDRKAALDTLRRLVDGRLLTTWEVDGAGEGEGEHRVEIIHESLLAAWPRLVRWQAQDVEGARLRDDLRQSARMWHERGRPEDLLWTGTAFREVRLWRERYAGGLSDIEEDFVGAMTELAGRRRRRRRSAATAIGLTLAVVAIVMTILWLQSSTARNLAEAAGRRAEAQKLLALGQMELEDHPTGALAYARASLGLADTAEARRFALEALWHGGASVVLHEGDFNVRYKAEFSPDGRWLATPSNRTVRVYPDDGGAPRELAGPSSFFDRRVGFDLQGEVLVMWGMQDPEVHFFSLSEQRLLRSNPVSELGRPHVPRGCENGDWLITRSGGPKPFRAWPVHGGEPATLPRPPPTDGRCYADLGNRRYVFFRGQNVMVRPLETGASEVVVGSHEQKVGWVSWAGSGDRIASVDEPRRDARIWSRDEGTWSLERVLAVSPGMDMRGHLQFSPGGKLLVWGSLNPPAVLLYRLAGPPDARPTELPVQGAAALVHSIHPDGSWLAVASAGQEVILWPLDRPFSFLLGGRRFAWDRLAFTPDSDFLVGAHRAWPLRPTAGTGFEFFYTGFAVHPDGRCIARSSLEKIELLCPARAARTLLDDGRFRNALAFDHTGQLLAVATSTWVDSPQQQALHVVDLESGEIREHPLIDTPEATTDTDGGIMSVSFAPDGRLFSGGWGGVRCWDLGRGSSEWIHEAYFAELSLSRDGQRLLVGSGSGSDDVQGFVELHLLDLSTRGTQRITTHGSLLRSIALDPPGWIIATGGQDGAVRVGPATGEAPHLLLGHEGPVISVAISPDCRWVASEADDGIRLWPMPDLDRIPLHTLGHGKLLARLDTLTNLRAVRDESSATGWKLEVGPFPGWQDQPTW